MSVWVWFQIGAGSAEFFLYSSRKKRVDWGSDLAPVRATAVDHRQTIRIWIGAGSAEFFLCSSRKKRVDWGSDLAPVRATAVDHRQTIRIWVDDLIFTKSNPSMFGEFKETMRNEVAMTDMGSWHTYYLGIKVNQRGDGIFIPQEGYAKAILKKFKMDNSKPINTPIECGIKLSKHDEEKVLTQHFSRVSLEAYDT
ncbi:hypothetical protein ZIOFF_013753 [Zingiber officinale]|uniref:Reverse transcriptase Ty1/copia-type domain-containing protein n=1 Tax=Zingiber officinale TaxID=94328 RepID=A0A8J5HAI3_ZINOF|nr:hypothetical protein ZIOFF_013753 [Zingiber officinale]